jgi:hypothetical protein
VEEVSFAIVFGRRMGSLDIMAAIV